MRLSASSIKEGQECTLKTHWKYILKKSGKPQSISGLFGTALHDLIRLAFKYKQLNKEDFFNHYWEIMYKEDFCEEASKLELEPLLLQEYYLDGRKILNNFRKKILELKWDDVNIIGVEQYFRESITDDLTLSGYIDIVFEKDNEIYLVDWKSNKYSMPQNKIDESIQLTMYYFAMQKKNIEVNHLGLYFLRHNQFMKTTRTIKDVYNLMNLGIELQERLSSDVLEANVSKNNCKWCEFKTDCKAFNTKTRLQYHKINKVFL